jgi:hypothetical protein
MQAHSTSQGIAAVIVAGCTVSSTYRGRGRASRSTDCDARRTRLAEQSRARVALSRAFRVYLVSH